MCMKESGFCQKFRRGDISTCTFTRKRGGVPRKHNSLLVFGIFITLLSCSTLFADVHEGIWLLSKVWKADYSNYAFTKKNVGE